MTVLLNASNPKELSYWCITDRLPKTFIHSKTFTTSTVLFASIWQHNPVGGGRREGGVWFHSASNPGQRALKFWRLLQTALLTAVNSAQHKLEAYTVKNGPNQQSVRVLQSGSNALLNIDVQGFKLLPICCVFNGIKLVVVVMSGKRMVITLGQCCVSVVAVRR